MRNIKAILLPFLLFLSSNYCVALSENIAVSSTNVQSVGYLYERWNKNNRWHMLELSLKLESQTFFSGDPIPIKVYLVNTGKEEVTIDGIRPLSGAQTPPSLRLARNTVKKWTTRTAFAAGVKKELIDTPKIRIKAGQSCILMDTDLLELEKEGFLFREMKSSSFVHYNPKLEEGTYTISATFSQEAFTSTTDKVDFHIVKNTSDQPKEDK